MSLLALATGLRDRASTWAKVLLGVLMPLACAALVLDQGVWTREEAVQGPFAVEGSPDYHAFFIHVRGDVPLPCCMEVRSDNPDRPFQSDLKLWINGEEMGPSHSVHADIRQGNTRAYSHWSGFVRLALPDGLQNDARVHARMSYSLRPTRLTVWLLVFPTLTLGLLLYWEAIAAFLERRGKTVLVVPYRLARGLGYLGLAAIAILVASVAYAYVTGWALPTTAPLRWSATARWLAAHEPWLGQALIGVAALGAIATWLALLVPGGQELIEREEAALLRFFRIWGIPIAACCLVLSISAMWSGRVRPGDMQESSIGGLLSFADAADYVNDAFDQARDGLWPAATGTLRRPIASAFRSLLLFSADYSVPRMLVIQIVVLATAMGTACLAIARWRGFWAALAFFGLSYTYVRTFAPTTLTEPLGLIWGFLSIAFFVRSLGTSSRPQALLGLGAMALSLMTRMGSMFAIPALVAWISFRRGEHQRIRAGTLAILGVIAVLSVNSVVGKLYGGGRAATGSNLSYIACGLAFGTTWDGCPHKLESEGRPIPEDENVLASILYRMALENVKAHPMVLIKGVVGGAAGFITTLPDVAWRGYRAATLEPPWFPSGALSWLCLIGVAAGLHRRREPNELAFWCWMIGAILVSAPFVYFDDGQRTLGTSYVVFFLFLAVGFSMPRRFRAHASVCFRPRRAAFAAAGALLLLVFIPAISHFIYSDERAIVDPSTVRAEDYLISGRHVSGFLVVPDDAPLQNAVPTLHLSDFAAILLASHVESRQALIHPELPSLPFGFVYAPRIGQALRSRTRYHFPATLLERHDVAVWRLSVQDQHPSHLRVPYWFRVTDAEALK